MSCYHPLKGIVIGKNPNNGKRIVKVISNSSFNGENVSFSGYEILSIPCGKCIGCRLDYSRVWADRMLAEASMHESNYFLTLTYDDDHLPPKKDGSPIHSLVLSDVQKFLKRLRKHFPEQKISYYLCGEYGSESFRPHYHLIIFGLKLDDLILRKVNPDTGNYYNSETISKLWTYGYHIICDVSWETCAYVARYVMKKQKGKGSSVYEKYNFEPEFATMSRRPAIGKRWFEEHKEELYSYGSLFLPSQNGAKKIRPNRYYDSLFDVEYPDVFEDIKIDRKSIMNDLNKIRSNLTDLSYRDILHSSEINKSESIKALKRKEIL